MKPELAIVIPVLLVLLAAPAHAEEFTGKVVGVSDGDTITVLRDKTPVKIRLHGVDCPEKAQPFGEKARQLTSKLVFGKLVTVKVATKDKYGRTVAKVYLTTREGIDHHDDGTHAPVDTRSLEEELLRAGLAWHYKQYDKSPRLAKLEEEARKARRGLWAEASPTPPWEWRHGGTGAPSGSGCRTDADCALDHSTALTDPKDPCSCARCGKSLPRAVNKTAAPKPASKPCAPRPCPACLVEAPPAMKAVCRDGRCAAVEVKPPAPAPAGALHGNTRSKVFHQAGCKGYDCKHCTAAFKTRDEAIKAGYKPCGGCKP